MNEDYFTIDEVAKKLRVTPWTIRQHIRQGKIKTQRAGKRILITQHAIEEYLDRQNKPPSQATAIAV